MDSPAAIYKNRFIELDQKWNKLSAKDSLDEGEFNTLHQETLELILDVSNLFVIAESCLIVLLTVPTGRQIKRHRRRTESTVHENALHNEIREPGSDGGHRERGGC